LVPHLTGLTISCICIDDPIEVAIDGVTLITDTLKKVDGWLGEFVVELESQQLKVDLVLDLSDKPQIPINVVPLGYFAPKNDKQALVEALQQLPDLIGTFDKPRYFEYNASICAHSRRGIKGCQQCIDACPAYAISSDKDAISVNPYLCQGCGSCTSACPSGALTYALPTLDVSLNRVRKMIQVFSELENTAPHILIHDLANGQGLISVFAEQFANHVIAFSIEELGGLSMAFWLNAIAFGAAGITVWDAGSHPDHDWSELQQEISKTNEMLSGLGYEENCVNFVISQNIETLKNTIANSGKALMIEPASYAGINDKRRMIKFAMQHLHTYAKTSVDILNLSPQSAFGEIQVDKQACTLCMSCVSVCPLGAVLDGGDKPQLTFIEDLCVQCGLCEQACPEDAIKLNPRFVFDSDVLRQPRVLNEEPIFHCISCNKGFATQKMIELMTEKLKDHAMFQGEALTRLKMCEDCRVKAMFKS
jgi:ferredoxin